jgi:NifU-like protein involved in Fe-S cluster formation
VSAPAQAKLYSPALLALATGLADYPLAPDLALRAEARSRSCGSVIVLGLATGERGEVARIGMQVSACAIGQASAMLLAQGAAGATPQAIAATGEGLARWLAGEGELPDWPGLGVLVPARAHPGRHEALLLPWKAAAMALLAGPAES